MLAQRFRNLSIRAKVGAILSLTFLVYTAVEQVVDRSSVTRAMEHYENEQAIEDLRRCEQAIQRELHHLKVFVSDWAAWDDSYDFVQTHEPGYIESNLVLETFQDNGINLICFFDTEGQLVYGEAHDVLSGAPLDLDLLLVFPRTMPPSPQGPLKPVSGLIATPLSPMLLCCHPIITSENEGPPRGMLAMGRLLTPDALANLREQIRVDFGLRALETLTTADTATAHRVREGGEPVIDASDLKTLHVFGVLPDFFGDTGFLVKADIPRTISMEARRIVREALFEALLAGLVFLLVLIVALRFTVLKPITGLTQDIVRINNTGDLSERIATDRGDEVGQLAHEFDRLLDKIELNIRRQTEASEALRISEAHLRAIVQAARDAVFTLDGNGLIQSANPAAQTIFLRKDSSLLQHSICEFLSSPKGVQGGLQTVLKAARILPDGFRGEVEGRRQDESTFPAYIMVKDFPAETGAMYVLFVADLTEIKNMHERVLRSRHLATIGEMGASIAHEIRNPLTGISSALQVLRKDPHRSPEEQALFDEILRQVKRVDRTVQSMLAFAKPWRPERRWCNVRDMLARSWEEATQQNATNGVAFMPEVDESLQAFADRDLAQQVFWNIMINAVQAMPEGGEIRATAWETVNEVCVAISDSGPGMEHEILAKAMNPFFTTRVAGTGLGLAICQRILEAHGGSIQIESTPGTGTRVVVAFPLEPIDAKANTGG